MNPEEQAFLRAIMAAPDDSATRSAYADWLLDCDDPRGELLVLEMKVARQEPNDNRPELQQRAAQLRSVFPSWWLAIIGSIQARPTPPDPARAEAVAAIRGRPARYLDAFGYEVSIVAAALSGISNDYAYVECRSRWRGSSEEVTYHLHLRGAGGSQPACELETYNPHFGCDVRFMEWFGDHILLIYREKHRAYVCRWGERSKIVFEVIEDEWVINGGQLGYRGWNEAQVRRLSLPSLAVLSPISETEARRLELWPG